MQPHTCVCVYDRDAKVIRSAEIFIGEKKKKKKKRVVAVKKYTCSLFVLKSEPHWICLQNVDFCAYVLLYRPIIAHCAGRAGPCVLQSLCGVVVLK